MSNMTDTHTHKRCPILLPVRYDKGSATIFDSKGGVVVPSMTWKSDFNHLNRQDEVGEWIVELINSCQVTQTVEEKRPRGNPNWIKK